MSEYQAIHNAILSLLQETEARGLYFDPDTKEVEEEYSTYKFDVEAIGPLTSEFEVAQTGREFRQERSAFEWLARGAFPVQVDFVEWEENIGEKAFTETSGIYPFVLELSTVEYREPPRGEESAVQVSLTFNVKTMRKR